MVHTFFYATLFHETGLHCDQQLVKHVYRLMDERDAEVGYFFIVHALYGGSIRFLDLLTTCILSHLLIARMKRPPLLHVSHPKVILVVVEQFFQTGFGYIGQFDLCLA